MLNCVQLLSMEVTAAQRLKTWGTLHVNNHWRLSKVCSDCFWLTRSLQCCQAVACSFGVHLSEVCSMLLPLLRQLSPLCKALFCNLCSFSNSRSNLQSGPHCFLACPQQISAYAMLMQFCKNMQLLIRHLSQQQADAY